MKKILIIEDDIFLFKVYKEMFKSEEYSVINATTGQEGWELIRSEKPNIILLDIMLPGGMNGFDVLEKVEATTETKKIPVIVLTNLDSEAKVATSIGAKKYFVKANTTKDQIVKAVKDCLQ